MTEQEQEILAFAVKFQCSYEAAERVIKSKEKRDD